MNAISVFALEAFLKDAQSVALVGNAPSILEHENGARIDACDVVIRFNRATTEGHEHLIGSRTDILVANASNSREMAPPPTQTTKPKMVVSFVNPTGIASLNETAFSDWVDGTPLLVTFGPEFCTDYEYAHTRPFTSGTYMLYVLLKMLSLKQLFVTGFNMFGSTSGGRAKFYADHREDPGLFHDVDVEARVFARTLASFEGELDCTPEVAELLQRFGLDGNSGSRSGSFKKRLASSLSWRLMQLAMRMRRISES